MYEKHVKLIRKSGPYLNCGALQGWLCKQVALAIVDVGQALGAIGDGDETFTRSKVEIFDIGRP